MRKPVSLFVAFLLSCSILMPSRAQAEIPVKAKAFISMAGYGAAGGALLGLATMAFGTSSRAVSQGASLGLYAGILFGTYVLVSHHQRRYGRYEDTSSPYKESSDIYGEDYQSDDGGMGSGSGSGFFDRFQVMKEQYHSQAFTFDSAKKKGGSMPPLQINFLQLSF
jgi:hypothetical protein